MIKTIVAKTYEIDSLEYALEEILDDLDLKELLTNSVGIISCHSNFISNGIIKGLQKELPFPIVGSTTCLAGWQDSCEGNVLLLTVLTSDDVSFKVSVSPELGVDYQKDVEKLYDEVTDSLSLTPAVVFTYAPLMHNLAADALVNTLSAYSQNKVPFFGTVAVDHTNDYATSQTIYGGNGYSTSLVLLALYGNVKVDFHVASLKNIILQKEKAVITKSNGNLLIEVNNISAAKYLESLGLTEYQITHGLGVLPLIVNYDGKNDEAARAVFALTPNGECVCGGEMPENTTISVGSINYDDIISTSTVVIQESLKEEGLLIGFSCVARYLVLGTRVKDEWNLFKDILGSNPFSLSYSGGEISAFKNPDGTYANHVHNYSLCILRIK
jgi:hypothetical protein